MQCIEEEEEEEGTYLQLIRDKELVQLFSLILCKMCLQTKGTLQKHTGLVVRPHLARVIDSCTCLPPARSPLPYDTHVQSSCGWISVLVRMQPIDMNLVICLYFDPSVKFAGCD